MNIVHVQACMGMCVYMLRVCYECVHVCVFTCMCMCVVDVYFSSVVCVSCSCRTGCVHMLTLRESL